MLSGANAEDGKFPLLVDKLSRNNTTLSTRLHPVRDVDFALGQAFRGVFLEVLYALNNYYSTKIR